MRTVLAGLLLAGFASTAVAQTAPAARPDCKAAEHHQLDFWVGEWRVFRPDGVEVASSSIQSVANGCAISENYNAPAAPGGPYQGLSYSAFDRKDGKWRQFYVDVSGAAAWFTGGLEGANMVLYAAGPNGGQQRMTYRPNADGSVSQIGAVSSDGGKTWSPTYDYTYRRK